MTRNNLLALLADNIVGLKQAGPILVGIDGIDGAGKTTLADELVPIIENHGRRVARASIDGFHNPREIRVAKGTLSPLGYFQDSFDYEFLIREFLEPLKNLESPRTLRAAKFDWKSEGEVNDKRITVDGKTILLFEGVFLFRPELDRFWSYKIFVDIEFDTSLARGMERDSHLLGGQDATREKYLNRYIPGQKLYFDSCDPKSKAQIVIKNDDPLSPQIV